MFAVIHNEDYLKYELESLTNKETYIHLPKLKLIGVLQENQDIPDLNAVFYWCNHNSFNGERSLSVGDLIAHKTSGNLWTYWIVEGLGFKRWTKSLDPRLLLANN